MDAHAMSFVICVIYACSDVYVCVLIRLKYNRVFIICSLLYTYVRIAQYVH